MTIKIVEVGMRDGFQNEEQVLPTEKKIELLNILLDAGMKNIEVTSFVHPKWVPQLADADQLVSLLPVANEQHSFRALVPNAHGYRRVVSPPLTEIAVFISASETHNLRNLNRTISQTLEHIQEVVTMAKRDQIQVRGYLSCVFGCPYEGAVAEHKVMELCEKLLSMGIYEISLGDTIGIATPNQVKNLLIQLSKRFPGQLAGHFHDTRGLALVNTYVALEAGITTFDSSLGGLGGCPYAPGASGNLATEELVYMLESMGMDTGINLEKLCAAAWWVEQELGKTLPSKVLRNYVAKRENVD